MNIGLMASERCDNDIAVELIMIFYRKRESWYLYIFVADAITNKEIIPSGVFIYNQMHILSEHLQLLEGLYTTSS